MKKLVIIGIIIIAIVGILSSCTRIPALGGPSTAKVTILENGTTDYLTIPARYRDAYKQGDTVWVNLTTHEIDDLDSNAMAGVILTIDGLTYH